MSNYAFCIVGQQGGCFLYNPLIFLSEHPILLAWLPVLGEARLLLLLMSTQVIMVYSVIFRSMVPVILIFCISVFWMMGCLRYPYEPVSRPLWLDTLGVVQQQIDQADDILTYHELVNSCETLTRNAHTLHNKELTCIIFPESSSYSVDLWQEIAFFDLPVTTCIIGSFRRDHVGSLYNTAYMIYKGKTAAWFDKQEPLIITERVPDYLKSICASYFKKAPHLVCGNNERRAWCLDRSLPPLVPYICSELFLSSSLYVPTKDACILSLCNDTWVPHYVRHTMTLCAQYRAICCQCDILYISYAHALFFNTYGEKHYLTHLLKPGIVF